MGEWRAKVIEVREPSLGKRVLSAADEVLGLAALAGVAAFIGASIGLTPGGPLRQPTYVIEGVVIEDSFETDYEGLGMYINPALEAIGVEPVRSLPPYLDSYQVTLLFGSEQIHIEFLDWALGSDTSLEEIAEEIEQGDVIRVAMYQGLDRYYGVSVEKVGEGERPGSGLFNDEKLRPTPMHMALAQGFTKTLGGLGLHRIQDAYLVHTLSSDEVLGPVLSDKQNLAESLYELLLERDTNYCPDAAAENVLLLDHADLIRLFLFTEFLDNPENLTDIGRMMEKDTFDLTAEHGGWARLSGDELVFHRLPSACRTCGDNRYHFLFNQFNLSLDTLAMFHFHAQPGVSESACPSGMGFGEFGDVDTTREAKIPGYLFSSLPDKRFNASFYALSENGSDAVVINLGPYDY